MKGEECSVMFLLSRHCHHIGKKARKQKQHGKIQAHAYSLLAVRSASSHEKENSVMAVTVRKGCNTDGGFAGGEREQRGHAKTTLLEQRAEWLDEKGGHTAARTRGCEDTGQAPKGSGKQPGRQARNAERPESLQTRPEGKDGKQSPPFSPGHGS